MNTMDRLLLPCSGVSNVGRLSFEASILYVDELGGTVLSIARVACHDLDVTDLTMAGIVAVDGCETRCATRILQSFGITPKFHLLISDLGISKEDEAEIDELQLQLVKDGIEACSIKPSSYFPKMAGGCGCR